MRTADEKPQDIIQFYNLVFIPAMKDHLLRVCGVVGNGAAPAAAAPASANGEHNSPEGPGPTQLSPDLSTARGGASPRHVSAGGGRDVFVSTCTPNAHLTPRTRTLYAFSDTPAGGAERLRDINSNINGAATGGSALDVLSQTAANGAAPAAEPVANGGHANGSSARGELNLGGAGGGVMASGHKRSRALMEPQRSGSSAASDDTSDN